MTTSKNTSQIVLVDVSSDSPDLLAALDRLSMRLKASGRGNRSDVQGMAQLLVALYRIRAASNRLGIAYLNKSEMNNAAVISALEDLGVFKGILDKTELANFKQRGQLPAGTRILIQTAAEYFLGVVAEVF